MARLRPVAVLRLPRLLSPALCYRLFSRELPAVIALLSACYQRGTAAVVFPINGVTNRC